MSLSLNDGVADSIIYFRSSDGTGCEDKAKVACPRFAIAAF